MKGGKADKKTAEDIAMKHYQFVGTVEQAIEKGAKIEMEHTDDKEIAKEIAMDHLWEFYEYYSEKDGLPAMEKELKKDQKKDKGSKNESIKSKIKTLLREAIELDVIDETPGDVTQHILVNGKNGGEMTIRVNDLNDSDVIEIVSINLEKPYRKLKVLQDVVASIWLSYPDINKMVVSPTNDVIKNMNFTGVFWEKLYFTRLNDDFLIRLRH